MIFMREFVTHKPFYPEKQSAYYEDKYRDQYKHSEHIARSENKLIDKSCYVERFFASTDTVEHHFDAAQQYHAKTPENYCMKEPDNRTPEYFCLPECYFEHQADAFSVISDGERFGKFEKRPQSHDRIRKHTKGDKQSDDE